MNVKFDYRYIIFELEKFCFIMELEFSYGISLLELKMFYPCLRVQAGAVLERNYVAIVLLLAPPSRQIHRNTHGSVIVMGRLEPARLLPCQQRYWTVVVGI